MGEKNETPLSWGNSIIVSETSWKKIHESLSPQIPKLIRGVTLLESTRCNYVQEKASEKILD